MKTDKKIHRFLVSTLPACAVGEIITIVDERMVHQVHRVLRLQPGETIIVFINGGSSMSLHITETSPHAITGEITAVTAVIAPPRTIIAAISIVKGDAFELIVQKLTELGVHTIVPLLTSRTIKQAVRIDRLQAISDEALEQSGGNVRVVITEPLTLAACFEQFPFPSVILDPLATTTTVEELSDTMVFYVGPEGGWDEQDESIISFYTPQYCKVTDRILRTETAAIVGAYTLLWK
jgi:16S rRNA (uracil1498-N3)-methyltransferase